MPLAITPVTVMKSWPVDESVDFRIEAVHSTTEHGSGSDLAVWCHSTRMAQDDKWSLSQSARSLPLPVL